MKKNRKIIMILTFLFVFVTIFSNIRVQAQENHKKIKVNTKLSVNSEILSKSQMGDEKQHLEDAHFNKFKSKIDKVTSLKMNLDIIPGDECNSVSGQSVLHIGKENYSFTVEGNLDTFNINNKTVFYGPVFGKLKNKQKEDSTIIGLYYDPSTDTTIASLSVGDLSKDGVTLCYSAKRIQTIQT
ncbi:hypothetical protein [Clostridium thermarum]|uniref:hypothetical protein n=1 Tax=Clostridium thermarum TaxID=1716543 RepID=UPI0011248088|nr:hypothetical protein [Clostridium thermarum]